MKTYRIVILGCRSRGRAAALAYHEHPRTQGIGLCDLVSERREELGELLGVEAQFEDLSLMIRDTEPDIVAIPTGTEFHYELAMRVLELGVNIDVEKPLTTHLYKADEILETARKNGVRVAVHHQGRTGYTMRAVKQAVREGRIGDVRYVQGSGKGYYGGYGLMNIGTHILNNMLGITGPCHRVSASVTTDGRPITPEDVIPSANGMGPIAGEKITAYLDFENGVTGSLLQHRFGKVDSNAYGLEVYGSEGRLIWRSGAVWWSPTAHVTPDVEWQVLEPINPVGHSDASASKVDDYWFADEYVHALDEGRDHESAGTEGRHVMEIMMGVFESGAYGRCVELPQAERDHPLERWRADAGLGELPQMPRDYGRWLEAEDRRLGR